MRISKNSNMGNVDFETGEVNKYEEGTLILSPLEQEVAAAKSKRDSLPEMHPHERNMKYPNATKFCGEYFVALPAQDELFCDDATSPTLIKLIYLATFMDKDNMLYIGKGGTKSPMTKKEMRELINVHRHTFDTFWKECIEKQFIIEDDGKYYLSKEYFRFGKVSDVDTKKQALVNMYKFSIRFLYEHTDPKSQNKLGYIYRLIPFLSITNNVLALNPLETDESKLKRLSLGNICDLLGVDRHNQKRILQGLKDLKFTDKTGVVRSVITYTWAFSNHDIYWVKLNPELCKTYLKDEDIEKALMEFNAYDDMPTDKLLTMA